MTKKGCKIKGVQYRKVCKCLNLHLDRRATKLIGCHYLRQRRIEARLLMMHTVVNGLIKLSVLLYEEVACDLTILSTEI